MSVNKYSFLIALFFCCNQPIQNKIPAPVDSLKPPVTKRVINAGLVCTESENKNADHPEDPDIISICTWRGFKFVKRGVADFAGRYSYEYAVYQILGNNKELEVTNSGVFNELLPELEKEINNNVIKRLKELKSEDDESTKECLLNIEPRIYTMDEMQIFFDQIGNIVFKVDLGLGSACFAVTEIEVNVPIEKIEKFIK
ncbi:MAG: hypothetical protein FGM61_00225 [Sediminibacterium sp.]|nr:hypothetical protein [Sediminibacterium sp.]